MWCWLCWKPSLFSTYCLILTSPSWFKNTEGSGCDLSWSAYFPKIPSAPCLQLSPPVLRTPRRLTLQQTAVLRVNTLARLSSCLPHNCFRSPLRRVPDVGPRSGEDINADSERCTVWWLYSELGGKGWSLRGGTQWHEVIEGEKVCSEPKWCRKLSNVFSTCALLWQTILINISSMM